MKAAGSCNAVCTLMASSISYDALGTFNYMFQACIRVLCGCRTILSIFLDISDRTGTVVHMKLRSRNRKCFKVIITTHWTQHLKCRSSGRSKIHSDVIWTSPGCPLDVQTYFERPVSVQYRCCAQWEVTYDNAHCQSLL